MAIIARGFICYAAGMAGVVNEIINALLACHTERSYLETARGLGYQETDAVQWAEAVMLRLHLTQPILAA
jgi:hypothetical protein